MTKIIFLSISFLAVVSSANANICTKNSLQKFRDGTFKTEFLAKRYSEAADALESYMKNNDCRTSLTNDEENEDLLRSYYWAINDIALARLKAGEFTKCIELTSKTFDNPYSPFPLQPSKVLDAGIYNLNKCQEGRRNGLVVQKDDETLKCDSKILGLQVTGADLGETEHADMSFNISNVVKAYKLKSKVACLALIKIKFGKEYFPEYSEDMIPEIPFLVTVQDQKATVLKGLNYANRADWHIGDLELTFLENSTKSRSGFEVSGLYKFWDYGTAAGAYSSLWLEDSAGLNQADEIDIGLH
jgi:hypothetical protein